MSIQDIIGILDKEIASAKRQREQSRGDANHWLWHDGYLTALREVRKGILDRIENEQQTSTNQTNNQEV